MKNQLRVGLLGLGVVGGGTVEVLATQKEKITQQTGVEITIAKALVRPNEDKKQIAEEHGFELTTAIEEIVEDPTIDVVVELIGKIHPAKEFIASALSNKKHVVTANKDLIAQHGVELIQLATENQVSLFYEASVAGGIPILRTMTTNYLADEITNVQGIVNGTTNYMLTKMVEEGTSYEAALKQAQELGFAESDPTNDVDGLDAAYKMVILTQFAYGMDVSLADVAIQGIRGLAAEDVSIAQHFGYDIKLIGESKKTNGTVEVSVGPTLVKQSHPIAAIKNEFNGVFITSTGIGQSMFYGPGAGALPTATSVVSDLVAIAKNSQSNLIAPAFNDYRQKTTLTSKEAQISEYYLALTFDSGKETREVLAILEDIGFIIEKHKISESNGVQRVGLLLSQISRKDLEIKVDALPVDVKVEQMMKVMGD